MDTSSPPEKPRYPFSQRLFAWLQVTFGLFIVLGILVASVWIVETLVLLIR